MRKPRTVFDRLTRATKSYALGWSSPVSPLFVASAGFLLGAALRVVYPESSAGDTARVYTFAAWAAAYTRAARSWNPPMGIVDQSDGCVPMVLWNGYVTVLALLLMKSDPHRIASALIGVVLLWVSPTAGIGKLFGGLPLFWGFQRTGSLVYDALLPALNLLLLGAGLLVHRRRSAARLRAAREELARMVEPGDGTSPDTTP